MTKTVSGPLSSVFITVTVIVKLGFDLSTAELDGAVERETNASVEIIKLGVAEEVVTT